VFNRWLNFLFLKKKTLTEARNVLLGIKQENDLLKRKLAEYMVGKKMTGEIPNNLGVSPKINPPSHFSINPQQFNFSVNQPPKYSSSVNVKTMDM